MMLRKVLEEQKKRSLLKISLSESISSNANMMRIQSVVPINSTDTDQNLCDKCYSVLNLLIDTVITVA